LTYKVLKNVTTGLLYGDTILPEDDDVLNGLVGYALTTIAMKTDSLHLMTLNAQGDILRLAQGDYMIRVPVTPVLDNDYIDIDEELVPAVARLLASYVSTTKGGIHVNAADRIMLDYNAKTSELIESFKINEDGSYDV